MENQNQQSKVQGWIDVQINENMPINALVQFLNILNQRLCAVEDNLFVKTPEGKMMSLTELYAEQTQKEAEERANQANEPTEPTQN